MLSTVRALPVEEFALVGVGDGADLVAWLAEKMGDQGLTFELESEDAESIRVTTSLDGSSRMDVFPVGSYVSSVGAYAVAPADFAARYAVSPS